MADRKIKLGTKMPDGDANGLLDPDVVRLLLDHPAQLRVGIIILDVSKIETEMDSGDVIGHARLKRMELVTDDQRGDASALERLLMRAYERRSGATTLDAELEGDVREVFDRLKGLDLQAEAGDE